VVLTKWNKGLYQWERIFRLKANNFIFSQH
jgi:hypothetical protein